MTDYTELIRSLRNCSNNRCTPCDCGWFDKYQVDESCKEIIMWKAADAIEALQAEVERLELDNEDYEHEHRRLKGEIEALEAQLPKRGEWIYEDLDNFRKYKVTCPHCGAWFVGNYDAYDDPSEFLYCPHCGNICNPTNLDWENELKEREKEARAKEELKAAQPHWVSVEDELPNDGEWAIFTNGKVVSVERFKEDAYNHFFPVSQWFDFEDAIAWMPLPEPPKEDA